MMEDSRAEELEDIYGMPPGRVMYHLYWEKGLSAGQIADELSENGFEASRSNVKYWLQNAGIKMRSRTLTDVQRILLMAYLSTGLGVDSASEKAQCGRATVHRYKKEIESTGEPVDLDNEYGTREYDILRDIINDDITNDIDSPESTSDCVADSD